MIITLPVLGLRGMRLVGDDGVVVVGGGVVWRAKVCDRRMLLRLSVIGS